MDYFQNAKLDDKSTGLTHTSSHHRITEQAVAMSEDDIVKAIALCLILGFCLMIMSQVA
ncbi:hypothetical protein MCP04_07290 [Leptolyngbya boryana IU 594]|jgi:hypothetical protein|uniref:hypothetical protein n=1 Tax=Leptolyngbya boryana TaxID=1184 RepID=UPI00037A2440|nr:hypothetical protein [Leptolyngbya boryana]MBD2365623.1 hypothetical protein [Leptolyngbya sp. FACHB-161]MBD2371803.1 hypothetical protein [Leptolyngbya sp. FACHB-238]MBD2396228.1 hypothetical protein [Leptolyngbya sp. FACHB-239]ULP31549.1 hypothetical protein MCP04_07290 [Leptolyngbya boryana IU 594]